MKIDHVAIYVKNLEAAKNFFCRYFKGTVGEMYHNTKTGFMSYFISFEDGARLEVMTRPEMAENQHQQQFIGYVHLAFSVGSREDVISLTERLRTDGYKIESEPRMTGDGYFESVVLDHEDNIVEITI